MTIRRDSQIVQMTSLPGGSRCWPPTRPHLSGRFLHLASASQESKPRALTRPPARASHTAGPRVKGQGHRGASPWEPWRARSAPSESAEADVIVRRRLNLRFDANSVRGGHVRARGRRIWGEWDRTPACVCRTVFLVSAASSGSHCPPRIAPNARRQRVLAA